MQGVRVATARLHGKFRSTRTRRRVAVSSDSAAKVATPAGNFTPGMCVARTRATD
jgi:hypothetical protein